ncbi:TauD/TfdA family dioxygenase [Ramlibacter sp.]|uniref:TauD/TfdA family dioxygenase n=1 Tax=Ramlibacter sp. TaxID=1917967 RepID=UPI003D0FB065
MTQAVAAEPSATAQAGGPAPEIRRTRIEGPDVWTAASVGGKEGLKYPLSAKHLAAIDALLAATRHKPIQAVTRAEFSHPDLDPMLAEVFDILQHGRGALVITGITPEKYDAEAMERIYWGFGTHWGEAIVQSAKGDRIGRVRFVPVGPDNPTNRAYRGNDELTLHSDSNEIVGLMCVQKAAEGGYSRLVNVLAIHNDILEMRPELLEPLYRGLPYATREASVTGKPVTPHSVPVFGCVDGQVSCHYVREFMTRAATVLGIPFPEDLKEALDFFDQRAKANAVEFMLEPGEIMMVNNFTTLHARTNFKDGPGNVRDLMRHWLNVPNGRRVIPPQDRKNYA